MNILSPFFYHYPRYYPEYRIYRLDADHHRLTLKVPGFSEEEISITLEGDTLKITGQQSNENESFAHSFTLPEYTEVTSAQLKNGILTLEIARVVPENLKPKKIQITQAAPTLEASK